MAIRPALTLITCVAFGAAVLTPQWCRRGADEVFDESLEADRAWGRGVHRWTTTKLDPEAFATGSELFDGEWLFGTHVMAALGFLQTARRHPALSAQHVAWAEASVDAILSKRVRAFDRGRHGEDPLDTLHEDGAHAAYLGYLGVVLGLLRRVDPDTRHKALHDRIAAALRRRIEAGDNGLVATYPGEWYPVDNLAVLATLRTAGGHDAFVDATLTAFTKKYVDPDSGLLVQAVDASGRVVDGPRGSGTTLGAYFAAYADPKLARRLALAVERELARDVFEMGWVREYPAGQDGRGDIDSGPILLGAGLSATGFGLATARLANDREAFAARWAMATLWGAPLQLDGARQWVVGGPLGNAILFAMTTVEVSL
ncbi:MAG: hypothetical protein RIT81_39355 [Deltaproteobacteria bacterium]